MTTPKRKVLTIKEAAELIEGLTEYPVKTEKGIMYNQNHRTACNHIDYRLLFM